MVEVLKKIEQLWHSRHNISKAQSKKDKALIIIKTAMTMLNQGTICIVEKKDNLWVVNDIVQKAILLLFMLSKSRIINGQYSNWYDKVSMLYETYNIENFKSQTSFHHHVRKQMMMASCTYKT